MAFGVFMHRPDSIYDDSPAERYQFPRQYLSRVEACISDWIVYLEPTKVRNTRGYFAVAKVQQVIPDPGAPSMYIAVIEPGSYLDFATLVPFNGPEGVIERGLLNEKGRLSGRAQAAVRGISAEDFSRILASGLDGEMPFLPRVDLSEPSQGLNEDPAPYEAEAIRERVPVLGSRIVRERAFRCAVLRAYNRQCAVTGLKLINGGGRAEVEAAHIKPVQSNGPDSVANGIALSGTAHWMFDRGLISLSDDFEIIVSRQVNDRDGVQAFLNRTGRAIVPPRASYQPHPHFLQWHRDNCFKG